MTCHAGLDEIPATAWNALQGAECPFLRHEFLIALERHGAVGERHGWLPQHLAAYDDAGVLLGAVPLYLKDNSYGELVFDWAWADAYARHGLEYYPKLVAAVPYTPATGARLLLHPAAGPAVHEALIAAGLERAQQLGVSSLHWLFPTALQRDWLEQAGFLCRTGYQFHWHNRGYRDFEDFLAGLTAEKRKKLKRERRHPAEAGITLEVRHGDDMGAAEWSAMHRFYRSTFERKSGMPTLNRACFEELGHTLGRALVLVLARHQGHYVAGAICFRGPDTLYGRHWGCDAEYPSLHFEACYYQGIDYCIREGLQHFEPGAQGEHKIARGFLPTETYSAHWIADPGFRAAIADFLTRERRAVTDHIAQLSSHSPYKNSVAA